jgi:Ca2+-transporting ATPase
VNHLFYPIQLLYINLVTDGIPALSLAFAPRSTNTMKEPPQTGVHLLQKREKSYILTVGSIASIVTLGIYFMYLRYTNEPLAKAAVFSGLTFIQQFVLLDLWFGGRSIMSHMKQLLSPIFIGAFVLPFITQLFILRIPAVAEIFSIPSVSMGQYWIFVALSFGSFVLMRTIRRFVRI